VIIVPTSERASPPIRFPRPRPPARPVVDVSARHDADGRLRWLENGKDAEGRGLDARAARGDRAFLERATQAALPGMKDELTRYFDRDRTDPPLFKHGRRVLPANAPRRAAGESCTRGSTAATCCCSIRSRSTRPAKDRRSAPSYPIATRRGSRSACTRKGTERKDSGSSTARPARRSGR
jgi:hypothetical protein